MTLKAIRTLAVTSAVLAGVAGVGATMIQAAAPTATTITASATRVDPMSNLVAAIAKKFNLNQSDVQKVFDEQRTQMDAQRDTEQASRLKTELDQAVTSGKLTQAQENLIIAKQAEIKSFHDSLKGKTREECEAAMKTEMASVAQWAKDNNIPTQYLMMGGPGGGPRGGHGGPDGAQDQRGFGGPGEFGGRGQFGGRGPGNFGGPQNGGNGPQAEHPTQN